MGSGALDRVPRSLIGAVEGFARFRQRGTQRCPRFASGLFQLLQSRFGFGGVRFHTFDGGVNVVSARGRDFAKLLLEGIGGLAPCLYLCSGYIPECGLLLLDFLADCIEVVFHLTFERCPL